MPVTLSYDLTTISDNDRTYVRSMLERFHWRRLGGSVFRYDGVQNAEGELYEDWLNHVIPSLMFMRSFLLARSVTLRFFTMDASSSTFVDHSDPAQTYGNPPQSSGEVDFAVPTNEQSSIRRIKAFIDQSTLATAPPAQDDIADA